METLEAGSRHRYESLSTSNSGFRSIDHECRDPLPSIGLLDLDKAKNDGSDFRPRYPTMPGPRGAEVPLVSPTTMQHSGPPPPYSYPSSATSSAPGHSGYISPPESRRTFEDEKDSHVHRQSLPSIHEALGSDKSLPYSTPAPTSNAPPSHTPTIANTPSTAHRPAPDAGPSGPPNPFSHGQVTAPYLRENPYAQMRSQPEPQRSNGGPSAPPSQDPRAPTFQALNGPKSPPPPPRTASQSYSSTPYAPSYDYQPKPSATTSPNGYNPPYQAPFGYSTQPPSAPSSYPTAPYDSRAYPGGWKAGGPEQMRPDKRVISRAPPGPPHNESIKRQLDVFDIEASLNEVGFPRDVFLLH